MLTFFRFSILAAVMFLNFQLSAQVRPELKVLIDKAIDAARNRSVNAHLVNWDTIQNKMYVRAAYATSPEDLQDAFSFMMKSLNDKTGYFKNITTNSMIACADNDCSTMSAPEKEAQSSEQFQYEILKHGVRYLRFSSLPAEADLQKEASIIRSAIDSLSKDDASKWIIDLRNLKDGHVLALLAGSSALAGEGLVAALVDGREKIKKLYEVHNGRFYDDQQLVLHFPLGVDLSSARIGILIDHNTAGPGEVLAVILKGRKNTKVFGSPSAGNLALTGNHMISKDIEMCLTENYYQDRKGNVHRNGIEPDVKVNPDEHGGNKDQVLAAAMDWVSSHGNVQSTASLSAH